MAQRSAAQITSNEGDIQLAISSIKSGQLKHNRRAADTYNVAESTLRGRRAGVSYLPDAIASPTQRSLPSEKRR